MKRFLLWTAVVFLAVMIFWFSAQSGEDSTDTSNSLIHAALSAVSPSYREMNAQEQQAVLDDVRGIVRKAAHFTEFCLFGMALYALCREYEKKQSLWIALGCGIGYAMTDEFHQMFIPGRAASWKDVGIDSAGVLCGVLVLMGVMNICLRRKSERSRKKFDIPGTI